MQIETGVVITSLTGIIGLSAWVGALWQTVNGHDETIKNNHQNAETSMERFRLENREDHNQIFRKLDDLSKYIRNGHTNG